jgi:hypothetical protein
VKKRFFHTLPASQPAAAAAAVATSRRPRRPRDAYVDLLADL